MKVHLSNNNNDPMIWFECVTGNKNILIIYNVADITNDLCEINEVQVEPCKEASKNQACRIKRGKNAGIDVYFTPSKFI